MTYLGRCARTSELPAQILLPGHGEPITDHVALIDERFALHRRRAEKLNGLIAERPRTAYEIAQELWGNVAVTQAFLTLSEVVGHVDLLIEAGVVREVPTATWSASRRRVTTARLRSPARECHRPRRRPEPAAPARVRERRGAPLRTRKKRMLIIVNPYATTVSDRLKNLVVYALQGRYEVEAVLTEAQNHATEIGREARDGGYDIVVAFGGDGTLNEVANGLAGTDVPVSVLPGGSTNVVAARSGSPTTSSTRPSTCSGSPTASSPARSTSGSPTGAISCSPAARASTRPRRSGSTATRS